jgi:hypothetical protein
MLKSDGTYVATWGHRDIGLQGEATGTWRVSGQTIVLSPSSETGTMEEYLRALEIIFEGTGFVLVRPEDRAQAKETENNGGQNNFHGYALAIWSFQRRAAVPAGAADPWR